MTEYLTILERGATSWGAYAPDVLGCIAVEDTRESVKQIFQEALRNHLDWMREEGDPIPAPRAETDTVTIALSGQPPRRYLAILQPTPLGSWLVSAADVPDLSLEFSTREGAVRLLQTALQNHLENMAASGETIPEPVSEASTVTIHLADLSVAA